MEGPRSQSGLSLQETQQIPTEEVVLEVLLSNGQKVKVTILTSDQTEDVLEVPQLLCWAGPALPAEFCGFPHVQPLGPPCCAPTPQRGCLGGREEQWSYKGCARALESLSAPRLVSAGPQLSHGGSDPPGPTCPRRGRGAAFLPVGSPQNAAGGIPPRDEDVEVLPLWEVVTSCSRSQAVASKLDLPDDLVGYFSLFLVRETKDGAFSCE